MNTLNSDIFWNINFAANAASSNVKFDYYALSWYLKMVFAIQKDKHIGVIGEIILP